jgi:hypothetical protein
MPPQTTRDRIIEALQDLSPDATFDDALERLVFLAKSDAGLADLETGQSVEQIPKGHSVRQREPWTSAYAELSHLAELPTDWDGEGSGPPTRSAIAAARQLLGWAASLTTMVDPVGTLPFAIAPLPGAGVLLDWRCRAADLEVDVGSAGQLGYLFIDRTGPERRFEEADDVPLAQILQLLLRAFSAK